MTKGNKKRMVSIWNELLEDVVKVGTNIMFEKHLNRFVDRKDWEEYGTLVGKWN